MLTIAASQLQFYQKKIYRLQMEVITLQEELFNLKTTNLDQYKIKYELLLDRVAQQKQLKQSQRSQSILHTQKTINQINQKWETILNQRVAQFNQQIQTLSQDKNNLRNKVVELQMKSIKLQKDIDEGDSQILTIKLQAIKKENDRLRKENGELYASRQEIIHQMKEEMEIKIQSVKQREKGFYRDQIEALQKKIEEIQVVLQSQRQKISPQRQQLIHSLKKQIVSLKSAHDDQLEQLAKLLDKRNKEFSIYRQQSQRTKEHNFQLISDLTKQLKSLQQKLFKNNFDREIQLKSLHAQMSRKRQNQANDLKNELQAMNFSFQKERSQWKILIDQAQQNGTLLKRDVEQQRKKFIQEKRLLKQKIQELKSAIRQRQQQRAKGESQIYMKSLKDFNYTEQKFTTYENAITFMDRQVRKSAMKIQQKNRQINNLLEELKTLQAESQEQVRQIKEKFKKEESKLYDKIFTLEEELDNVNQALKEKDKYIKKKQADLIQQQQGHQSEVQSLKKIIQEMQRDYRRITGNKKNLQDSYREQRENVISGKLDINQEKKKKWVQLVRQRNQLQIVYRERMMQLKGQFQTQIDKLKREKQRYAEEREEYRAEVQLLRERLNQAPQNKQNKAVQYQKKLATLDLQIALTQTLFKTLSNATSKKKSELQQISENQSSSQSFEIRVTDVMTPPFTSVQMPKQEIYKGATYSFTPYGNNK